MAALFPAAAAPRLIAVPGAAATFTIPTEELAAVWVDLWKGIRDVVDASAWDRLHGLVEQQHEDAPHQ